MDYLLGKGEVVTLAGVARQTVTVRAGALWLTVAGDGRDYLLAGGERFTVTADALLVLEALADAVVGVDCPAERPLHLPLLAAVCRSNG